jgi:hypothetical protein
MGEAQSQPFQLSFNPMLKVEFLGSRVTSDGNLILVRELDARLDFSALIVRHLTDPRGPNTPFPLADLVRQSVYRRWAGYEDVNDAERLSQDPTFRLIGSEPRWERGAALTSRAHSFGTELLTQDENLAGLAAITQELIATVAPADARNGGRARMWSSGPMPALPNRSSMSPCQRDSARGWRIRTGPNRLSWGRRSHSSPKRQMDFFNKGCSDTDNGSSG